MSSMEGRETCRDCDGAGWFRGTSGGAICKICGGRGFVQKDNPSPHIAMKLLTQTADELLRRSELLIATIQDLNEMVRKLKPLK